MASQARYAALRHRRGNPDTRFAVTYTYGCTLSTLPSDGTLVPKDLRGFRVDLASPWRHGFTWG